MAVPMSILCRVAIPTTTTTSTTTLTAHISSSSSFSVVAATATAAAIRLRSCPRSDRGGLRRWSSNNSSSRSSSSRNTGAVATTTTMTTTTANNNTHHYHHWAPMIRRGIQTLDFGGQKETVYERSDYPKAKLQQVLGNDTLAVIGYGTQGRAQSLNARDHGLRVIVGCRKGGPSWTAAEKDGWVPGKTLFPMEEACAKGTVIMNLLSDAGQKEAWPAMVPHLTKGKTLYFSHGFGVVYADQTGIVPPKDIDVVLVAPKGSGTTVRSLFLEGRGINASVAVHQDASGHALERAVAIGVAIGSGYLYQTAFFHEVTSDLTGERGVLMGALQGLFQAQYDVLRAKGHSPSEAFNETVEEATQSLYPLVGAKGMDWMYANCSATAQRGALDWAPQFYKATKPVFETLYESVASGREAQRTLECNARADYRKGLQAELEEMRNSELWRAGATVRKLRPENQKK